MPINARDWYWLVTDHAGVVYSSARNIYVPTSDSAYVAWQANGNEAVTIASEAELWAIVKQRAPGLIPDWMFDDTSFARPSAEAWSKDQLKAYAAQKRWEVETGGATVGGLQVITTRESQSQITAAWSMARNDSTITIPWKAANGSWVVLDSATIQGFALGIAFFVQQCFAAEHTIADQITGGSITTPTQVDAAFAATVSNVIG